MGKITLTDLFLAVLALLLVSVSFYQTWLGLEQIFGNASVIIAMVLSLLLLFLIWMIKSSKASGKSVGTLVWIYVFIASFCFVANFNALYTRFMKNDIYTEELRRINANFNHLETDVESNLNYKYDKETAQNIEIKKKQLIAQIQDPGNKGIGTRAKALIRDLERLLGQKIDLLTPVGNDYEDLARRMGRQVDNMVSDLSPEEQILKADINNAVLKWNKKIQEFLLLPKADQDMVAQGLIDKSLEEYNKLGNKAHTILGDDKFKFSMIKSSTQDIGKMGFAFKNAIENFSVYPIIILMGCILLDFVIVIIVLLVVKPDDTNNGGESVLGNRHRGKTLI